MKAVPKVESISFIQCVENSEGEAKEVEMITDTGTPASKVPMMISMSNEDKVSLTLKMELRNGEGCIGRDTKLKKILQRTRLQKQ